MKTLRILLLTSFFLAACAPVASVDNGGSASSAMGITSSADGADDTGGNGETGAAASADAAARVIEIRASDWAFAPNAITVKKGEKVTLKITGDSGVHGIGIPGLGVSQRIELGQSVSIELPTETAGSYDFRCNVPCGAGHKEMKGTIVIEE